MTLQTEVPIGYLVREQGGSTPSKKERDYWDGEVPWVSPKDMKVDLIKDSIDHVSLKAVGESALQMVPESSVLIVVRGMILSHSVPVAETAAQVTINQDMKALVPLQRISGRFLRYSLVAAKEQLLGLVEEAGHGTRCLRSENWRKFKLSVPSRTYQNVIAAFLDSKTAAIDALIEKKERLIELLAEQRAALIHRAVTKGLSPDVPMKDSGVSWIGEIPLHWQVKRLKFLILFSTSGSRGWADHFTEDPEDPVFLQSGNLGGNLELDWTQVQHVSPPHGSEGSRTRLQDEDVLICITGAKTGNVALAQAINANTFINQHVALLRPNRTFVRPKFLALSLVSQSATQQLLASQYGGTKQGLGLGDIAEVWVALSTVTKQDEILRVLDQRMESSRGAELRICRQIERLKEYRQALITAAVTGQLDIRGEDPDLIRDQEQRCNV